MRVEQRGVVPEYVPRLAGARDSTHFETEFELSLVARSDGAEDTRLERADEAFRGFSYYNTNFNT